MGRGKKSKSTSTPEELASQVTEVQDKQVTESTRKTYCQSIAYFIDKQKNSSAVSGSWKGLQHDVIVEWLCNQREHDEPPVDFDKLMWEDVCTWLQFHQDKNMSASERVSFSRMCTHRSAFKFLFNMYDQTTPSTIEKGVSTYFKGLQRVKAQKKAAGDDVVLNERLQPVEALMMQINQQLAANNQQQSQFTQQQQQQQQQQEQQ